MRPSFTSIYMELAHGLAARSTCTRKQVGCVIATADYRQIVSVGYNGNARGLHNGCDHPDVSGGCGCLHAEENAVIACDHPRYSRKVVLSTVAPCVLCAKRLINLTGVIHLFHAAPYRDDTGVALLRSVGIGVTPYG